MFALSLDLGGLVAGLTISTITSVIRIAPWILIMYPLLLTLRGNTNGVFSGRLTTALHIGMIYTRFTKNTRYFYNLLREIILINLINAFMISGIVYLMSALVLKTLMNPMIIVTTTFAVILIGIFFSVTLTWFTAVFSYKKGLDPDLVVYPIMSTINDILVTLFFVIISSIIVTLNLFSLSLISVPLYILVALVLVITIRGLTASGESKKSISEVVPLMIFLALLSGITGSVLTQLRSVIAAYPAILIIYPALIDTLGDEGGIIGSTTTTRLALGYFSPKFKSLLNREFIQIVVSVLGVSVLLHFIYGFIGGFATAAIFSEIIKITAAVTIANLLGFLLVLIISFTIAIQTYKRGLDPDNFSIPITATLSDFIATFFLFVSISIVLI
ncbi:MAG: magnesium transporter [Candidatus Odinarchaeia archaeon]